MHQGRTRAEVRSKPLRCLVGAAFGVLLATMVSADTEPGGKYLYYLTGNAANVERSTTGLIVAQGGGDDVDENYVQWASAAAAVISS